MTTRLGHRGQSAAARVSLRVPSRAHALAAPPTGSGLEPVYGVAGPPIAGYTFEALTDTIGLSRRLYERFGEVSWIGAFGMKRVAFVLGPPAIEEVLVNRDKAFANRGWENVLEPFFHRGVMLLDFEEHLHDRRIMQQAFGRQDLIGYLDLMNPVITRVLDRWQPSDGFRVFDQAKLLTLDVATEVFLGEHVGGPEAGRITASFVDSVDACQAVVRAGVPGGAWRRGLKGRAFLEDYVRSQIADKRAHAGSDLFSRLCGAVSEEGERFEEDDIVNHMIFVLLAAHDTSTITLSNIVYFLGKHPEWQERLRADALALSKPVIGYDDLDTLRSYDLVMKEALRMYAPVGIMLRETIKDTALRGRFIPAGTPVALGIYPTMRMEPWWQNPDLFDPERFSDERREDKSHRLAWAPFGAGAHKCIGMHFGGLEVKAILHQLLLRFEWSVPASYEPPMNYGTGPIPVDGLPITLSPVRKAVS